MKKTIQKISAIAMAFTLLGTGTTIAKNVNSNFSSTTLTAHAVDRNTPHNHGQFTGTRTEYVFQFCDTSVVANGQNYYAYPGCYLYVYRKAKVRYCRACNSRMSIVEYYNDYRVECR